MQTPSPRTVRNASLILSLLLATLARAQTKDVTLAWDHSSSPEVTGYVLHYGKIGGTVTNTLAVGYATSRTITGLQDKTTYFFYATSVDAFGVESQPSEVINHNTAEVPVPLGPRITKTQSLEYGMVLTWSSVPGRTYRVAYKENLQDPVWRPLSEDVVAGGALTSWADTEENTLGRRFYAVLLVP